ncbi:MAG: L,D-transpeptidase [Aestuariivita sp.]|nr:L,D-transpeptidase [Aestuariivita sp.]
MSHSKFSRRSMLGGIAATLSVPSIIEAQEPISPAVEGPAIPERNTSFFQRRYWRDYFSNLRLGCILCDISGRAVHFWTSDETYRLYPSSVPMTDELTRRGRTHIARMKLNPSWTPTEHMRKEDPTLPTFMPPGPENPLGTHALYLTWPAYLIHGTHDTRKIGRQSSSGCIGLYNQHIKQLYDLTKIGTQVLIL